MTVVLTPWRPGDRWRRRAMLYIQSFWEHLSLPLFTGDVPGPFNRSAARNAAARAAGAWDVAILADADTIIRPADAVLMAVELARSSGRIVVPHDEYVGLSETGTAMVVNGSAAGFRSIARRKLTAPLGIVVIPRAAWDLLGGFDERFTIWGGEDTSFIHAARTLIGVDRIAGELVHLWHPIDARKRTYLANPPALTARYRQASGDRHAMLAILGEREAVAA